MALTAPARIAFLGSGAIARHVRDALCDLVPPLGTIAAVSSRASTPRELAALAARFGCPAAAQPRHLLAYAPTLIVEAASPAAVREHSLTFLAAGVDLVIMSVGALADDAFRAELEAAAERYARRVVTPSGAIGGLDVLRAAAAGLTSVTLTTTKPPRALAGAPFFVENPVDLAALTAPTVVFDGSAVEAIRHFPANVNVAIAVGLAGIGLERTRCIIVADPRANTNLHEIDAVGAFGRLQVRVENEPMSDNPRTSRLAAASAVSAIRRMLEPYRLG